MKRIFASITVMFVIMGTAITACSSPGPQSSESSGLDHKEGFVITYEATPMEGGAPVTKEALIMTVQSLEARAEALGLSKPEIRVVGTKRIRVRLADVTDEDEVRRRLGEPALLTFRSKDGTEASADEYNVVEMTGSDLIKEGTELVYNQVNEPMVAIEFKSKDKLAEVTERLLGQQLAIFMNDILISDPMIQAVLTDGRASISIGGDLQAARDLCDLINLGALPLKLTEIEN
ncbi:SecDF P1 head subdomain-containing protein [Fontibacillus sp. BL9]|uniref:SecDF P1 head subdomain-containing protein n=1 Tax=Fontibacillus sp. BL9 TaxID=3389971 RepID=UPI0039781190